MRKTGVVFLCTVITAIGFFSSASAGENESVQNEMGQAEASGDQDMDMQSDSKIREIAFDESWEYAQNSAIHTGTALLYRADPQDPSKRRDVTVCVNAGHGTAGGGDVKTLSHPDGTPKVTGGTTAEGAVYSTAVSSGTTFIDGTTEAQINLNVAQKLRDLLLEDGYDVLMIRDSEDVQLDNIARTVMANNHADLHVAIHFDATDTDKGAFYCGVPEIESYRQMEPVKTHFSQHEMLGRALLQGFSETGLKVWSEGRLSMDLTQTSYSTIPSVDFEVGDRASAHTEEACAAYAAALKAGIDNFC